ncbi:hypothetical protein [Leisingera sp. ANG-Vp]|uniref:hypothetical protein n=1 Tax=Leisingera sp. ANG-Vp TaxID=1577896 RepID=UPI00057C948E|nr:hypothetical protein [Leisingera sp. ANG-Vp]KIC17702.1 hypothetical protein RA20_15220 [Leisingera sp. ANG-Vp]
MLDAHPPEYDFLEKWFERDLGSIGGEPDSYIMRALQGCNTFFELHPDTTVTGWGGRLYQCWLFMQYYTGAQGRHTADATLFINGWRGVDHVLTIARLLRMPELVQHLEALKDKLAAYPESTLDLYDRDSRIGIRNRAEPLDKGIREELLKLLNFSNDAAVENTSCQGAEGIPVFTESRHQIDDEIAAYLHAMWHRHPAVVAELGDPDDAPRPEHPIEPLDEHSYAVRAGFGWFDPQALALDICAEAGLWVARDVDVSISHLVLYDSRLFVRKLQTHCGKDLCVVMFRDAVMVVDFKTWTEIGSTKSSHYETRGRKTAKYQEVRKLLKKLLTGRSKWPSSFGQGMNVYRHARSDTLSELIAVLKRKEQPHLLRYKQKPQFWVHPVTLAITHARKGQPIPAQLTYRKDSK